MKIEINSTNLVKKHYPDIKTLEDFDKKYTRRMTYQDIFVIESVYQYYIDINDEKSAEKVEKIYLADNVKIINGHGFLLTDHVSIGFDRICGNVDVEGPIYISIPNIREVYKMGNIN